MAIVVERKTRKVNWLALSIGLFVLIFVAGAVYFLFVAAAPAIERFISLPLAENRVVQNVQDILNAVGEVSVVIKKLDVFEDPIPLPTPGELGRDNPFLPI